MQRETDVSRPPAAYVSISILSLYAEGDELARSLPGKILISILSLYAEGDTAN